MTPWRTQLLGFYRPNGALLAVALSLAVLVSTAAAQQYDVVVYGGTSAAVTAAVEVARLGKSVVIVSPDHHLGGLSSNGLGWTDIGSRDTIGGLSREFYARVYDHYLDSTAWTTETRQQYISRAPLDPDTARRMMFTFEPKVAEQIFDEFVAEANVPVVSGRLDRTSGVTKNGQAITSIRTEGGQTFTGKAFIDATYEGDLMAAAGVTYAIGREPNSQFGEQLNGIQLARATKNQLPSGIDPYVVPGNPASGLLPGVNSTAGGADGAGDERLQAYNFRMVLTNRAANRTPVPQPAGYDEADYELLFRAIEAGQTGSFFKLDAMPNNKTDSNNNGGISTDFIGGNYSLETNWNYAEADCVSREEMIAAHRNYQMGLVWTLQNHPRVPESIRNSWDDWGLPLDEFTDNGHWPNQIYVREARRMVGEVVINQRHVDQEAGFELADSIGMGGYNMDSHNVQRVVANGEVRNEGDVQVPPANGPYGISYRSIVTREGEADNLLVPVALSATHIAYGSIRMEPVFMALGQSAGAAAVMVGERELAARDVPYSLLHSRLVRAGQVLGTEFVSPDPGVLLNFGATVADNTNSPGHALGGVSATTWNLITGDSAAGVKNASGAATEISVKLGKSAAGVQEIDWDAGGLSTIAAGSQLNTGLYAGNASSALFVNDGANSQVDLGVRISGLTAGVYDAFVVAKNTNTTANESFNIYSLVVDAESGDTNYSGATPQTMIHATDTVWRHGVNTVASTFEVSGGEDLVIVVEGVTANQLRGFLNTLELAKLAAPQSADVNGDGHVNLDDFSLIRQNYLANVTLGTSGDANADGLVNHQDFYFWRRVYLDEGGDPVHVNTLHVPEPATGTYTFAVASFLSRFRVHVAATPCRTQLAQALFVRVQRLMDVCIRQLQCVTFRKHS